MSLLITCDTGGWKTPSRLRSRLEGTQLESATILRDQSIVAGAVHHAPLARAGIDRESNLAARRLAYRSGATIICNEYRADLIDVGRSLHHRELHSPAARALPQSTRDAIVEEIYTPYRNRIERQILDLLRSWTYVVHLSVRTFDAKTSEGRWRRGDVGLLYDPARPDELDWCLDLVEELYVTAPDLKVRRNHPGRGTNDSLTKSMRAIFSEDVYLGIELVLNRAWMARPVVLRDIVLDKLGEAIGSLSAEQVNRAA
ncbi:N-formylglutamate amidohydrolase [Aporhodopirellula aestuarii]|uniref:N-formylglutamate amidohydrolase n=1 Tax=Aporhodopirellula aestuarii TaxID=2950107 RepID=A0ABT0TXI0_9BACT|nr:N-formylglutamate amidohydrolase [Aporhodopirellula aestuarii]MCM2369301.1 N-formylglutamate amidohydrolase [Aporhodopirellula aestuarii]